MNKNKLHAIFAMACFVLLIGCKKDSSYRPQSLSGVIWGTVYNITYNAVDNVAEETVSAAVLNALNVVDSVANAFNPQSEISIFNSKGSLENPSSDFLQLLAASLHVSKNSSGAFDPTIGPLVDLWGFGPDKADDNPDEEELTKALALVGMDNVAIIEKEVKTVKPGVRLDFAAIAKGYGVDRVASALDELGIQDFMVEIGGEVRVKGRSPRDEWWTVQIDAPVPDQSGRHEQLTIVRLKDASVATSGNYRNFRTTEDGKIVYHTISPITGRPDESEILSATIFAADDMTADAYATASMVMDLPEAIKMIEKLSTDKANGIYGAIFVTSGDGNSPFVIHDVSIDEEHVITYLPKE